MNLDDPQAAAERYALMARENYERDGELNPIMAICSEERTAICLMQGTDDLPLAFGRTIAMAATILRPSFVVTVTEVWKKSYDGAGKTEREMRKATGEIQRGDLAKMVEAGDETVQTALMTIAWTMDPTQAVAVIDTVLDDKSYDRVITVGEQEGYMIDRVIGGWKFGLTLPAPDFEMTPEMLVGMMGAGGDVAAVLMELA